mmetsp:Transcript_63294/g.131683  ORF Transcript_63294/g.131683 Transcript_63294/m.131683 type:complete len:186 (-) Transcript_63294:59-616(-)|eukprot:CAMPEP_0181315504 /NCGR_PEP_ID=MMETSP1101-20121128/15415_1 /TAXON_ID=46948 /ORGANISM="Rhodomonas abbreviata, Strain Caron Lab Isolate" /LENGTH=185 /DNA_ID=CAMNT_0023422725 /DNA_START=162 /DNA_END=719 /DNA_ORIENTATION=-
MAERQRQRGARQPEKQQQQFSLEHEAMNLWKGWEEGFTSAVSGLQTHANQAVTGLFTSASSVIQVIPAGLPALAPSQANASDSAMQRTHSSQGKGNASARNPANFADGRPTATGVSHQDGRLTSAKAAMQGSQRTVTSQKSRGGLERKLSRSSTVHRGKSGEHKDCDGATLSKIEIWLEQSRRTD